MNNESYYYPITSHIQVSTCFSTDVCVSSNIPGFPQQQIILSGFPEVRSVGIERCAWCHTRLKLDDRNACTNCGAPA